MKMIVVVTKVIEATKELKEPSRNLTLVAMNVTVVDQKVIKEGALSQLVVLKKEMISVFENYIGR